jgi:peroxiredoxin Q/BCP
MLINTGQAAPDFELPDEKGLTQRLSDYRGKHILLYFYPKDDTPGCTKEACNFRDDYSQYDRKNVVILGVSPDTPESHAKFMDKYELPFSLLADEDHQVCKLYGVWGPKKIFGKEVIGVHRTTYLIGPEGEVLKVFEKVSPAKHSAEVLAFIENK